MMGLYNEAVNLALENKLIYIAKLYANKPNSDELKKKLWLQVTRVLYIKIKIIRLQFLCLMKMKT